MIFDLPNERIGIKVKALIVWVQTSVAKIAWILGQKVKAVDQRDVGKFLCYLSNSIPDEEKATDLCDAVWVNAPDRRYRKDFGARIFFGKCVIKRGAILYEGIARRLFPIVGSVGNGNIIEVTFLGKLSIGCIKNIARDCLVERLGVKRI